MSFDCRRASLIYGVFAALELLAGCRQSNVVLGRDEQELGPVRATGGMRRAGSGGGPSDGGGAGDGAADAGADGGAGGPMPSWLPSKTRPCPILSSTGAYVFGDGVKRDMMVDIHIARDAKSRPGPGGPLILYWHSLGVTADEVAVALGDDAIDRVLDQGGVVAAFHGNSECGGCTTDDIVGVWFEEDDLIADQVVACAIEQARIDTRRIHELGFSAGGIRALRSAWSRSAYVASAAAYSGGIVTPLSPSLNTPEQDPTNPLPTLLSYGPTDLDMVVISFKETSLAWYRHQLARGAYTMMCEHAGMHMIPTDLVPQIERFFEDHPYKVDPEPYEGVPEGYASYCKDEP